LILTILAVLAADSNNKKIKTTQPLSNPESNAPGKADESEKERY
jgi:hypothetical protein